jgi:hypothetical protein
VVDRKVVYDWVKTPQLVLTVIDASVFGVAFFAQADKLAK